MITGDFKLPSILEIGSAVSAQAPVSVVASAVLEKQVFGGFNSSGSCFYR